MRPEAPEEPQTPEAEASPATVLPREAGESEAKEAEDLDAFYASYGLVRRWRVLPEPKPVPIDPQSAHGLPVLDEGDLIAYGGDGGVRDSSYFYFGNEKDGGRLLAGRLFRNNSKLEPGQIVHTWTEGEVNDPWVGAANPARPRSPEVRAEAREARLAARAVEARNEAALGNTELIEKFMAVDLGLWRGARWQEPVSTALLGDWASTLYTHGTIRRGALSRLMHEVREIHRQLTPLWRRRCAGERLLSLDVPVLENGLTLADLVAGGPDPADILTGVLPDDPRVLAVLEQMLPTERAVALAWSRSGTSSWTEAAVTVLALTSQAYAQGDAEALGERVRRKLKRLGRRAHHSWDGEEPSHFRATQSPGGGRADGRAAEAREA
ncbi:hypothetical protein GCM10009837_53150 [Streptomyces durmitorensis]|uniref:Uncharacterized protein n=1 Tax=Streptomyces durmitorensis TaxID=319947 RepID=A0ABY4PTW0_9ACTN|nr:hypothetical protein [Streptomyces durmitorensis]UQT57293.1 hypothetical protein M4V62_20530 [Streptomyces durmitorensis]